MQALELLKLPLHPVELVQGLGGGVQQHLPLPGHTVEESIVEHHIGLEAVDLILHGVELVAPLVIVIGGEGVQIGHRGGGQVGQGLGDVQMEDAAAEGGDAGIGQLPELRLGKGQGQGPARFP